ncbi:SNF2 domain-containing protein/helicase domain-containing protein/zinc finger protein-related [Abeliophyllum distichum]|uniref:SNF2 domain-containing protein/helicase domain-containing protein/zinc finger protein-related n=1 Tax=Abeliophyllum distichum TaxID=126358 RepID=A0ABD1PTI8_9LAMI
MMIAETDGRSSMIMEELFQADDNCDDVYLDLDSFWNLMGGPPEQDPSGPSQARPEDSSSNDTPQGLYHNQLMEENDLGTSVAHIGESCIIDGDGSSHEASHAESSSCEIPRGDIPDFFSENDDMYLLHSDNTSHFAPLKPDFPYSSGFKLSSDDDWMMDIMDEAEVPTQDFTRTMTFKDLVGSEVGQRNANFGSVNFVSASNGVPFTKSSDTHAVRSALDHTTPSIFSNVFGKVHDHVKIEKKGESITSSDIASRASEVIGGVIGRNFYGVTDGLSTNGDTKWSSSESLISSSSKNNLPHMKYEKDDIYFESKRARFSLGTVDETYAKNSTVVAHCCGPIVQAAEQPALLLSTSTDQQFSCLKTEHGTPKVNDSYLSNINLQGSHIGTMHQNYHVDDDSDLCILEDMSAPPCVNPTAASAKLVAASHLSTSRDPLSHNVTGHSRLRQNDERFIYRVALRDLSQPKSESTPPDGLLAVPLLKHQRIALSWMVNKETGVSCCSGGILADDQGLGKTISTIALILKERSPNSKASKANEEQCKTETLNLDEEDGVSEIYQSKQGAKSCQVERCPIVGGKTHMQAKGRPPAGTLVVCPTSVLRQWYDELHNKVTREADLSVLVYHGSNRTKDPLELAKYDVVLTTYSIVSMEVPKQPLVNEDDDEIEAESRFYGRKRNHVETKKSSKSRKSKKGIDNELLETISGPLAKVGWFRVVLDEAQSIKNHRTQTARACWGLRAKRRWCLSGTPIQNAIDDLYSYFRFLRYDPYAVFQYFCSTLKVPIHRNPKVGYKKLQAVLKTIMLRRTKGTLIDGEPIINLPPKTIELKKVDFSKEERDFYCSLEADSRAQFAEYAAAGTVKQNYVNILLMLLRLRQACDHPLLISGFSTDSKTTSSVEMAKKLPREKQVCLLNCLEASLAICGICSDPPEDAVVTVCGHVFCNQCISEHLTGDDAQCPTKTCKTRLDISSVFSVTTLRIALSDGSSKSNINGSSSSEEAQVSEPSSLRCPYDSSKIKAALEVLLSLSKPQDCTSRTSSSESSVGASFSENLPGKVNESPDMSGCSNTSVKVVGEKAIVFSQWTRMLDLLESCLRDSSIQYRRLDGTMSVSARDKAVKDFNTCPEVTVMIMSLKAASLGLNMVAACHVLLLDLWWNPTTEDQAIDRAHRIGQTRPVSVLRLTVKDTVEDRILALQQKKRVMVASAFGEDETGSRQTRLTVDDLKYLFNG